MIIAQMLKKKKTGKKTSCTSTQIYQITVNAWNKSWSLNM